MTLQTIQIMRLTLGGWAAIAVAYALAWPLYFLTPIFTCMFLSMPLPWIGWKTASRMLSWLAFSLLLGLLISEIFLGYPLICILLYGVLFFLIYYNDTPAAPPLSVMFMTLGITIVPIMGLQGSQGSHIIALGLFGNMAVGLVLTWLFHGLISNKRAEALPASSSQKPPAPTPVAQQERVRLALVSMLVALSAVVIFFSLNLAQYALAMIYVCFMAGTPSANASMQAMKGNALATAIGGIAIIVVFELLVMVPTYLFLLAITLLVMLLFSQKVFSGQPSAKAFASGLSTFLVLLGSSTGVDSVASADFYARIAQVLFAGLFCVVAVVVIEHLTRPGRKYKFFSRLLGS